MKIYPVYRAILSEKLVLGIYGIPVVLNTAYSLSILLVEIKLSIRILTNKILMNLLQPWNRQSQAKWCRQGDEHEVQKPVTHKQGLLAMHREV